MRHPGPKAGISDKDQLTIFPWKSLPGKSLMSILYWVLVFGAVLLAAAIIAEDARTLAIDAWKVLTFSGVLAALAVISPIGANTIPDNVIAGAGAAIAGLVVRIYIRLRTGTSAFGAADILILGGGGALLGPGLAGPWILASVATAIGLAGLFRIFGWRKIEIDGETQIALPLCPALILTGTLLYISAEAGLFQ